MTLLHGGTVLGILLAVATFALVVTPPGPPAVAEFAPRASERIDEALKAQSSRFGNGQGGDCAVGQDCEDVGGGGSGDDPSATTSTTSGDQSVIDRARVRRCVGDPPRQTEDPQSPPCVNYWEGDNGGATYKGVTRDEIRVAMARGEIDTAAKHLIDHFNTRYEFYGRKIRLMPLRVYEPKAVATAADEEAHAFAIASAAEPETQVEAARRGLVSTAGTGTYATSGLYGGLAPYAWGYAPALDEIATNLGRFVCTTLADRAARFAGAKLRTQQRKFAVVTSRTTGRRADLTALHDTLRQCGVKSTSTVEIDTQADDDPGHVGTTSARWEQDGVTTLLVFARSDEITQYMSKLRSDFEPEWVVSGVASHENEAQWGVVTPANYRRSLFGTFSLNKLLPREDTPSWWAYKDGAPDAEDEKIEDFDRAASYGFNETYHALLVLASGLQMAGPNLTPQTFAAGLQKARFPNPNAGAAPYYQARVGFGPGDYSMADGASAVWWSDAAPAYGSGGLTKQGGWCYVGRGRRFTPPTWSDLSNSLFDADPRNCR